jgi:hypothetical protein
MNKRKVSPIFVIALVLIGLPILSACQTAQPIRAAAAPEYSDLAEKKIAVEADRWNAMAEAYQRHEALNTSYSPEDVLAYRWLAMAQAYEKFGLLNDKLDVEDVMADRWNAMAEAYHQHSTFENSSNLDVVADRWNAMAEAYQRFGAFGEEVDSVDASTLRWNAIAQDSLRLDKLNPEDISAYRWNAIAQAYERLGLLNDK